MHVRRISTSVAQPRCRSAAVKPEPVSKKRSSAHVQNRQRESKRRVMIYIDYLSIARTKPHPKRYLGVVFHSEFGLESEENNFLPLL